MLISIVSNPIKVLVVSVVIVVVGGFFSKNLDKKMLDPKKLLCPNIFGKRNVAQKIRVKQNFDLNFFKNSWDIAAKNYVQKVWVSNSRDYDYIEKCPQDKCCVNKKSPWQLAFVKEGPRNLPLKYDWNQVRPYVTMTVGNCSRCSQEPTFKVWSNSDQQHLSWDIEWWVVVVVVKSFSRKTQALGLGYVGGLTKSYQEQLRYCC